MHRNIGRAGGGTTVRAERRRAPSGASQGLRAKWLGCLNPRLQVPQQRRDFGGVT